MKTLTEYERRLERVVDKIRKLPTLEAIVLLDKFVVSLIESDREKLLKALSDETMYDYDDIFKKVKSKP